MLRKFQNLTFTDARQSPQVSALTKTDPELADDCAEALGNLITFTCAQFNIGKNMNDVQVAILANDLLKTYWHWRFDEFVYVFGQAVRGIYGPVYDRIDAPTVGEWCRKYEADRGAMLEAEGQSRAAGYKRAELGPPPSDTTTPEAQALRAQLEAMPDDELKQGWQFYRSLPEPLALEQALKLAVATEVVNARRRAHYMPLVLARFQDADGRTPEQQRHDGEAEYRRIKGALLAGDLEGAGLPADLVAEYLDWEGQSVPKPTPIDAPLS